MTLKQQRSLSPHFWWIPAVITIVILGVALWGVPRLQSPNALIAKELLSTAGLSNPQPDVIENVQKLLDASYLQVTQDEVRDRKRVRNILVLILIAGWMGLFGGVVNYSVERSEVTTGEVDSSPTLGTSVITGVAASLLVPLSLHVIGSNIVEQSETDSYQYLIFLGFCLVAAIYSKRFISTVADQALKKAESAAEVAQETVEDMSKVKREFEEYKRDESRHQEANNAINLANHHQHAGQYQEALESLEDSLRIFPTARAWGVKGNVFRKLGDAATDATKKNGFYQQAIAALTTALTTDRLTDEIKARVLWSRACYKALLNIEPQEIVKDLMAAIAIEPGYKTDVATDEDLKGYSRHNELVQTLL